MAATHLTFARKATAADPPAPVAVPRDRQIAEAAYHRAAVRGFAPGHALEDWLAAEREVDARLADEAHRR
jgi:hypothetical protein